VVGGTGAGGRRSPVLSRKLHAAACAAIQQHIPRQRSRLIRHGLAHFRTPRLIILQFRDIIHRGAGL
jgi:hypothetical protein